MRISSKKEGASWLSTRGLAKLDYDYLLKHYSQSSIFNIPQDSGRKTALARLLASLFNNSEESLLWITGYGIWPSSENPLLFAGYRKSLGEQRSLAESECHFFGSSDIPQIECLLAMILYFVWDAVIVDQATKTLIKVSHDEHITAYAIDSDRLSQIEKLLEPVT